MPLPPDLSSKLNYSVFSVMNALESLELPTSYGLADASGDTEVTGETFGTVVAARRNFKPFVIGIIPPDVAVDFIPFRRLDAVVGEAPQANFTNNKVAQARAASGEPPRSIPNAGGSIPTENAGVVPRKQVAVRGEDLRREIYNEYTRQLGYPPTEATVNLIASQMYAEPGNAPGGTYAVSFNYNFGNQTRGGRGQYAESENTLAKRKAKYGTEGKGYHPETNPTGGVANLPPTPSSGTAYLSVDYDGQNNAFPRYYRGFSSLNSSVATQVANLRSLYPNTLTAQTPTEYVDGLTNGVNGARYFAANRDKYEHGITTQYDAMTRATEQGRLGGKIGVDAVQPAPDDNKTAEDADADAPANNRFIMTTGSSTQLEADPSGDRIGRLTDVDLERLAIGRQQTDALRRQLETIRTTPGLVMLVNPSEFTRSYERSTDVAKGRKSNIVHNWLERPMTINSSGVTAGQYVVDGEGNGGLTGPLRVYSLSYENLLSLIGLYKTNGIVYSGPEADRGTPLLAYSVFIYYDNHMYIGSFESFDVSDTETRQHNIQYSWRFKTRYDMDVGNDGRFTDFEIGVNTSFNPVRLLGVS